MCALRDISAVWHHPQTLACFWEEYGTVPVLPQGSRRTSHAAWCRHMMGVWLLSQCPLPGQDTTGKRGKRPGTGHRQLVKLARGAHSILSHAIEAFRQGDFLAGTPGPASVVISGSPPFPTLQISVEFSRPSFSNVLP